MKAQYQKCKAFIFVEDHTKPTEKYLMKSEFSTKKQKTEKQPRKYQNIIIQFIQNSSYNINFKKRFMWIKLKSEVK